MGKNIYDAKKHKSDGRYTAKSELVLPLIALGFDVVPIFGVLIFEPSPLALLFVVLSPIVGMILGVVSLSRDKMRIGKAGKIISIVAIALPLALLAFYAIIIYRVVTAIIALM